MAAGLTHPAQAQPWRPLQGRTGNRADLSDPAATMSLCPARRPPEPAPSAERPTPRGSRTPGTARSDALAALLTRGTSTASALSATAGSVSAANTTGPHVHAPARGSLGCTPGRPSATPANAAAAAWTDTRSPRGTVHAPAPSPPARGTPAAPNRFGSDLTAASCVVRLSMGAPTMPCTARAHARPAVVTSTDRLRSAQHPSSGSTWAGSSPFGIGTVTSVTSPLTPHCAASTR